MRGPHYLAPLYAEEREEGTGTTEEFGATPVA